MPRSDRESAYELAAALADVVYVIRLEPDVGVEYVSDSVAVHLGHTSAEFRADPRLAWRAIDRRDHQVVRRALTHPLGEICRLEVRWTSADGRTVWTEQRCRRDRRDDGSLVLIGAARDVTASRERDRLSAQLQRSEERFRRSMAESAVPMCLIEPDGSFGDVNQAVCDFFGYPADLLKTKTWQQLTHPDDLEIDLAQAQRVLDGDIDHYRLTKRYVDSAGRVRFGDLSVTGVRNADGSVSHFVSQIVDMTHYLRAREQLARSERLFRTAMSAAPCGMAVVDLERRFREVNDSLVAMVGRDREWLLQHTVGDLLDPEDDLADLLMRDKLLTGGDSPIALEKRLRHADGHLVWVQHHVSLIHDESGKPLMYVSQYSDITMAKKQQADLEFIARHDPLTELPNRWVLEGRMSTILAEAGERRLGVLFCDLDNLKEINDTHGHGVGDDILAHVARRIADSVRHHDLVARIGGDEFVVLLEDAECDADLRRVADLIRDTVREPFVQSTVALTPRLSVGATLAVKGESPVAVLQRADRALYRAKRDGRDRTAIFDATIDGSADPSGVS
ncbi:MAG: PAS domain S-box protein [Candidatus Nanopelagicales bacterium]